MENQTQQNTSPVQPSIQAQPSEKTPPPPSIIETPKRKTPVFTIIFILFLLILGIVGYFGYQNYLLKNQIGVIQPSLVPSIKPIVPFNHPSITSGENTNQATSPATVSGRFCEMTLKDGRGTILYYENGSKYMLVHTTQIPNAEKTNTFNILYTGTHYYMWTSPLVLDPNVKSNASVYTNEEAHRLSLDESFQLKEIQQHPEQCRVENIATEKFIPPTDITFTTVQQMSDQMQQTSIENIVKLCKICLEQYKSKQEQLGCFSIGNIFTQYPDNIVETVFDKYCLKQ